MGSPKVIEFTEFLTLFLNPQSLNYSILVSDTKAFFPKLVPFLGLVVFPRFYTPKPMYGILVVLRILEDEGSVILLNGSHLKYDGTKYNSFFNGIRRVIPTLE